MAGTSSARFKAPWKLANLELPMSQDPSGVMLDMQYEDGEGDETYKTAFFYLNRRHDSWMGSIYSTNEYITAIASFITNSLVVLVFIRVLGYRRLPNQMMVNIALCQCLTATAYFVHSSLLITISKQAGSVCERSYKILSISWVLTWACMSCAVVERTLALNMPNFYQITIEFIGPVLVATPWLYAMLLVVCAEFFLFQVEDGFGCTHVIMHTPLEPTKRVLELISYLTLVVCLVSLILSRVLHSTHCDDAYEMNRVRLEMRTTMIIAQVAAIQVLYFSPLIITESIAYYDNSESMFERDVVHFCYELALHSTYVLFLVLMGRREFRRSLRYVFAKSEAIRRQRQPNYIVASETSRKRKSQSTLTVATPPLAEMTARDDTMQIDTPEWLRRKQSLLQSILGRADSVTPD